MAEFEQRKLVDNIGSDKGFMISVNPIAVLKVFRWVHDKIAIWKAERIIKEIESPKEQFPWGLFSIIGLKFRTSGLAPVPRLRLANSCYPLIDWLQSIKFNFEI